MPTIKYHETLGLNAITQEFDTESLRLHTMSTDEMTYVDKNGASIELHGTDFKYTSHGEVKSGTVSSIAVRDADGQVLETIRHIDPGHPASGEDPADPGDFAAKALSIYNDFKNYGASALTFVFNNDKDHITGSGKADFLEAGNGKDIVSAGGGDDILEGGSGPDRLTGGAGNDMFLFERGSGHDVITDFQDRHDRIEVAEGMYDRLEMHKSGDDLVLDFGGGDQVILEHVHKSVIGKDDFYLF